LNQSLQEIEIIAVNDGSTDESEDIIQKYAQQDSRISYYNQENKGSRQQGTMLCNMPRDSIFI